MRSYNQFASLAFAGLAAAVPAPQVPGYMNADAPYASNEPTPLGQLATVFGPDIQVPGIATTPTFTAPVRSSILTGATSHGPYSGVATTTGAVKASETLGASVPPLPPNPTATYYNTNGGLQNPAPAPYIPYGSCLCLIIFQEQC
jgi:hypothetical protein